LVPKTILLTTFCFPNSIKRRVDDPAQQRAGYR
jgi:hypothetical protein